MDMEDKAEELREWLRQRFPQHEFSVSIRGRQLTISVVSPVWPTESDPMVRVRCQPGGHWDISYWRHTGRWETIPPLGGSWLAVRQALTDDPLGLFWAGID